MKKDKDDDMLKQLKYTPPVDDDFDFILDDTEYKDKATQLPDIKNNFSQTIKKEMVDKETDTYDELNKIIGAYILQINSKNFKSKEPSRGELMTQARTVPVQQKRDEKSSSSSSDSEGFLGRNVRRGIRLAEIAGQTSLMAYNVLDTATGLTLDAAFALNNLMRQQNQEEEEEEAEAPNPVEEVVEEEASGSNDFIRERSRSHDDTDYEDVGERLLRRGASRSRSSTPDKKHSKKKWNLNILKYLKKCFYYVIVNIMSAVTEREIDEDGYVIIEPIIKMDIDKKADSKKYNRVYHREYYRKILSVKIECEHCGCSVSKQKISVHQKSAKCQRLREQHKEEGSVNEVK